MTRATKSKQFNLIGFSSKNSVYLACNLFMADAEGKEEELVEELNTNFVSPGFLLLGL